MQVCFCNSDRKQHAFCIILEWTFVSAANTEGTVKGVNKSLILFCIQGTPTIWDIERKLTTTDLYLTKVLFVLGF